MDLEVAISLKYCLLRKLNVGCHRRKTEPYIFELIRVWTGALFLLKDGITQRLYLSP